MAISALDVARVVGTVGTGMSAGLVLGVNLMGAWPVLASSNISKLGRLTYWSKMFDVGLATMVPLVIVSSTSLFAAAYLAAPPLAISNLISANRRAVLAAAGAAILAFLPFTRIVMYPGITELKKIEEEAVKTGVEPVQDTDAKILAWTKLHNVRIGLAVLSFVLVSVELAASAVSL